MKRIILALSALLITMISIFVFNGPSWAAVSLGFMSYLIVSVGLDR